MREVIKDVVPIVLIVLSTAGMLCSFIYGRMKKKATSKLTQSEQEKDLEVYMVKVITKTEVFSKNLNMAKGDLSKYKRDEVLDKVTMYAMGNNYTWYCPDTWGKKIDSYIKNANIASGKKTV